MFTTSKKIIAAVVVAFAVNATAEADERYTPVRDQTVIKECGACHMVFQPQMLPAKSWSKIIDGLPNHFGEDASVDAGTAKHIKAYHMKNAADSSWWGGKFMRGLTKTSAPLRITETPRWLHEHDDDEVPERAWSDPKVKSKANCPACHRRANEGDYDDD